MCYYSYRVDSCFYNTIILTQGVNNLLEIELTIKNRGPNCGFDDDVLSDSSKLNIFLNLSSLITGRQ